MIIINFKLELNFSVHVQPEFRIGLKLLNQNITNSEDSLVKEKMASKEVASPKPPQYPGAIISNLDFQVRWEIIANPEPLGELQEYATKTKDSRRMLQGTFLES